MSPKNSISSSSQWGIETDPRSGAYKASSPNIKGREVNGVEQDVDHTERSQESIEAITSSRPKHGPLIHLPIATLNSNDRGSPDTTYWNNIYSLDEDAASHTSSMTAHQESDPSKTTAQRRRSIGNDSDDSQESCVMCRENNERRRNQRFASGLPNAHEASRTQLKDDGVTDVSVDDIAPPLSPTSYDALLESYRGTIVIQVNLIRDLHKSLDKYRERVSDLEQHAIPRYLEWAENSRVSNERLSKDIVDLRDKNARLRAALVFSNQVIAGCVKREWAIWKSAQKLMQPEERKGLKDLARRVFRRPDRRGTNHSQQRAEMELDIAGHQPNMAEVGRLIASCKRSIEILQEDIDGMLELVKGAKGN
ncbi:hypothetical protein BU24DRAFT_424288, partial [Aaosphaeria arxii CBS 175.79]